MGLWGCGAVGLWSWCDCGAMGLTFETVEHHGEQALCPVRLLVDREDVRRQRVTLTNITTQVRAEVKGEGSTIRAQGWSNWSHIGECFKGRNMRSSVGFSRWVKSRDHVT